MSDNITKRTGSLTPLEPNALWQEHRSGVYRCRVYLSVRAGGGFVAVAAGLPAVAAEGETEQATLTALSQAIATELRAIMSRGGARPALAPENAPPANAADRWVIVRL